MKRFLVLSAAVMAVLLSSPAFAGNTQADPDVFRAAGRTGAFAGRSDGVYQEVNSKGVYILSNGTAAAPLGQGLYEDFSKWGAGKGLSQLAWSTGLTVAGLTTTVPAVLTLGDGMLLMWASVVTETLAPAMVATGLDISADLVDNDGLELFSGVLGASGRPFIVGKDPAFQFCATIKLTDVSGSDFMFAGFRIVAAMNATPTYTDFAAIGSVSGDIYLKTNLNSGGITSTDTTDNWADAETHKLCTLVSAAGVVTYKTDNAAPTTVAAFTLDDGDAVIPFVHLRHDADVAESTIITKWEVSYQ